MERKLSRRIAVEVSPAELVKYYHLGVKIFHLMPSTALVFFSATNFPVKIYIYIEVQLLPDIRYQICKQ